MALNDSHRQTLARVGQPSQLNGYSYLAEEKQSV